MCKDDILRVDGASAEVVQDRVEALRELVPEAFGEEGLDVDRLRAAIGETKTVYVDLAETFNHLIGLRVRRVRVIDGVRVVEGTNPEGDRALVLWRNCEQMGAGALDEWFGRQDYGAREPEFDLIYVNGDNTLQNTRPPGRTWQVRLIEEDFKRLMFDVEDV